MNAGSDSPVVNKINVSNDTEHLYRAIETLGQNVNSRFDAVDARFDRIEQEFKDKVSEDRFRAEIRRLDRETEILHGALAEEKEKAAEERATFRWRFGAVLSALAIVISASVALVVKYL